MKNRIISGLLFTLTGVLVILIPTVLFPVCDSGMMKMSCYYTKRAEIGVGALIAVIGLVSLLISDKKIRIGLAISEFFNAALVLLFPLKLTGLCKMSDMACRVKTEPALIVISIVIFIISAAEVLFLIKQVKKDGLS